MKYHFFKIVLSSSLSKLMIPKTFIRKYGEGLSNLALLKLPNGAEWKLELTQCDGGVWFQKGLEEFLEYYSIKFGHLLVFRYEGQYEGQSRFQVLVFDESATEIEYPFNSSHGADMLDPEILSFPGEETRADESDDSVEILDEFQKDTKAREKSWLPCPRPHKMMRTEPGEKTTSTSKMPKLAQQNLHSTKQEFEEVAGGIFTIERCTENNFPRTGKMRVDEKSRALEKASCFKPENPFFMAVMQPSYVMGSRNYLNLPSSFVKSYLNKNADVIILRVSDGRHWSVKYISHISATTSRGMFGCGWRAFSRDNNLAVGDVCVFELIKGIEISFQVVIFRSTHEHCPRSPGELNFPAEGGSNDKPDSQRRHQSQVFKRQPWTAGDKARALERAGDFRSENPFIMVAICPSHVCSNSNLAVPGSFLKSRYMTKRRHIVMLQVGDKSWPVTVLTTQPNDRVTMSGGWSTFARENKLQEGDVCVFELIKTDDDILKVSIFRCLG